jgi:hypothetical protein
VFRGFNYKNNGKVQVKWNESEVEWFHLGNKSLLPLMQEFRKRRIK